MSDAPEILRETPATSDSGTPTVAPVRRRRHRRKREKDQPVNKVHLILLVAIFGCLAFVFSDMRIRTTAKQSVRHLLPSMNVPVETIALVIAGLIMLYLLPGVEEWILRKLGIKKESRRNRPRSDAR